MTDALTEAEQWELLPLGTVVVSDQGMAAQVGMIDLTRWWWAATADDDRFTDSAMASGYAEAYGKQWRVAWVPADEEVDDA